MYQLTSVCSVYLWFKPTSLYEDKQLCSLSQTVSSSETESSCVWIDINAANIHINQDRNDQNNVPPDTMCRMWKLVEFGSIWWEDEERLCIRQNVCQPPDVGNIVEIPSQCLSVSLCILISGCLSVCLFNSFDFHESYNQLLLFYYQSTRWPHDAHVEEFTAVFHVNYKSI